jgi:hypothetical protein
LFFACKEKAQKHREPLPEDAPASAATLLVYSAKRCGECHVSIKKAWDSSAHARASVSMLYQAMLSQTKHEDCDACHSPFRGRSDVIETVFNEGVSCEVCHTMRDVQLSENGATFALHPEESTKYGPLCDAKAPYFHKLGCSSLHTEARFCAACHLLIKTTAQGERIPIFTEYEEWQKGPYSKDTPCQLCHMPGVKGIAAEGAPIREKVPHHGFLNDDGLLRQYALSGAAKITSEGENIIADIRLTNDGAGHSVPSGLPGRQIVLVVRSLALEGTLSVTEKIYQKTLSDAEGKELPFYTATKLLSDNRIAPNEVRKEHFELSAKGVTAIEVEIFWRELSPELTKMLGVAPPKEQRILYSRIPWKEGAAPIELALKTP